MRKIYTILAFTFLCLMVTQKSFAQDYQINDFDFQGQNDLVDLVVTNNSSNTDVTDYTYLMLLIQFNYPQDNDSELVNSGSNGTTNPYTTNYIWYKDVDGDGYHSQTATTEDYVSPGANDPVDYWVFGYSYGLDCDDNIFDSTNNCAIIKDPCIMSEISDHVYNTLNGMQEPGASNLNSSNISIVSPSELPSTLNVEWTNSSSSFNSTLYRVDNGNGNIEYVYATEGTVSLEDWKNDFEQGLGYASDQYTTSINNARELAQWANDNNYKLSFTGHSLGGGLANANALATGLPATIYNPAGLHDNTINTNNLNLNNSKNVTAYVVRGEPVDIANYLTGTDVRGTKKYIGSVSDPVLLYGTSVFLAGATFGTATVTALASGYHLHSMSNVISNLDCN